MTTCGIRLTGHREPCLWQPCAHPLVGVHADCTECASTANVVDRTMRAQCVEGGSNNTVAENVAHRCDSSVLVEQGARDTVLRDNEADDCRLDTLVWEST